MTNKIAQTSLPIHPLIANRWSPRGLADTPIADETVTAILEAARWSPSSNNSQPWRFKVVHKADEAAHAALVDCLMGGNQAWAAHVPLLMVAAAKTVRDDGKTSTIAPYDLGQAVAYMTIEAMQRNVFMHQMGGIFRDKVRALYTIPAEFEPFTVLAFGYLGSAENLPEWAQERESAPRQRNHLSDIIITDQWV